MMYRLARILDYKKLALATALAVVAGAILYFTRRR